MENNRLIIDTVNKKYMLGDKNIAPTLMKVEATITADYREVKLTYRQHELNLDGVMFSRDVLKPIICDCGNKISDYMFDCDCLCPKCKRHIITAAGHVLCDRFP